MRKIAEVGSVSVKFTGDDTDLRAKFTASKKAVKELEDAMLKASKIKLAGTEQKIKLTLDTAEANRSAADFRAKMAEMRSEKLELNLNSQKAKAELTGFQAFANSMLGKITIGNIIAGGALGAVGALNSALGQLNQTLQDSVNVSAKYEVAMKGLSSISKAFGQDSNAAQSAAQSLASDGLISVTQAAQTLKNLMSTGFSLSESMAIATSMKDIGAFNNVIGDLGQAMVDSSKGIKTGSMELIENIGLTERLSAVLKSAGVDISNGIDLTNNMAQRQAVLNSILKEGERNAGSAAEYANLYAGALDKTKASVTEFQKELGNLLKGPSGEFLKIFSSGIKEITLVIKRAGETRAQEVMASDLMNPRTSMYNMSIEQLQKSRDALQKEFDKNKDTFFAGGRKNNELFATDEQMRYWGKMLKTIQTADRILSEMAEKQKNTAKSIGNADNIVSENFISGFEEGKKELQNGMAEIARITGKTFVDTITEYSKGAKNIAGVQEISPEVEKGYTGYFDKLGKTETAVSMADVIQAEQDVLTAAQELKKAALELDRTQFINESGVYENTSGYDPSRAYAKETGETTLEGIKNFKKLQEEAKNSQKDISDVGTALSELGDTMQNDFIKSLGNVATGVQSAIDNMKMAQGGGLAGVVGSLGVVGAVAGIGMTLYSLLNPPAEKQLTAAEMMNDAADKFKEGLKGTSYSAKQSAIEGQLTYAKGLENRIKESDAKVQRLVKRREDIRQAAGKKPELWIEFVNLDNAVKEARKERNKLIQEQANALNNAASMSAEMRESLGLLWQDMAGSVRNAFNATNLGDFYLQFKAGLTDTIKNSLITAFLQSDAMIKAFEGLSSDIYKTLESTGFDLSKISNEQMKEWKSTIEKMSNEGATFFQILEKLGLAGENVTNSLNSMANTVNNIPQGVKVNLYRYQSLPKNVGGTGGGNSGIFDETGRPITPKTEIKIFLGDKPIKEIVREVQVTEKRTAWGA